jgi:uncharacterized protein (DUF4415 family)
MTEMRRRGEDRTDWARVKTMKEKEIVIDDDATEPTAEQWAKAIVIDRRPPKKNITLRIDPEIIDWFKARGKGYQTRMNAVLRVFIELQRKDHRKAS